MLESDSRSQIEDGIDSEFKRDTIDPMNITLSPLSDLKFDCQIEAQCPAH